MLGSMSSLRIRERRWWLVAIAAALLATLAALLIRPTLEHAVRARIEHAAARHGMVAHIAHVHVGLWPLVRLAGFDLELKPGVRAHADMIVATWPGHWRVAVRGATLAGPAGITVGSPLSAWIVKGLRGGDLRLTLVEPRSGLSIEKSKGPAGTAWKLDANDLDLSHLLDVRRDARPLLDGGIADGHVDLQSSADALRFHVDIGTRGARLGALSGNAADEPQLGDPTDVTLAFDGAWRRTVGTIEIPQLRATVAGATLMGALHVTDLATDPNVDLALGVRRLDFAQLLGTSGLELPDALDLPTGGNPDLGSAAIDLQVRGRLADPPSLSVTQKIAFTPPRAMPPAILRLRGDFSFSNDDGPAPQHAIDVSPASPDFIPLNEVPPLFVRTLLLAEDAGFYGHRGVDLRELPAAILTNLSRGGAARGASTITQQLAKNLFLSRDKQLGRKLQELAITFLLESALGKDRILEIYLNIIEWGPNLYGLRPAARAYFGREPRALTPAQMAFLVSIIPGPIKYQASFAHGTPGPGLQLLIDDLLAKLRSVGAISDEEYHRSLLEPITVAGASAPPAAAIRPTDRSMAPGATGS